MIATEIEERGPAEPDADVILQGLVSDVGNPTFKILGVEIDTSGLHEDEFKNVDDSPIGRAAFFNALVSNGVLVKAKGQLSAGNALAIGALREVELED